LPSFNSPQVAAPQAFKSGLPFSTVCRTTVTRPALRAMADSRCNWAICFCMPSADCRVVLTSRWATESRWLYEPSLDARYARTATKATTMTTTGIAARHDDVGRLSVSLEKVGPVSAMVVTMRRTLSTARQKRKEA
jgi:hypothetical protein